MRSLAMLTLLASAKASENIEEMSADDALSEHGQQYKLFLSVGNWRVSTSLRALYDADKICGRPVNMCARVNHSQKTITLRTKA